MMHCVVETGQGAQFVSCRFVFAFSSMKGMSDSSEGTSDELLC